MLKKILLPVLIIALVSCEKEPVKLYLFNWSDYMNPGLIKEFEQKENCKIILDTYDSDENMLSKVMNTTNHYDLVFPTGDHVSIMKELDLIVRIEKAKLSNYNNLDSRILGKCESFDPENNYSVPYFWGTSGLLYNRMYLSDEEMKNVSWNIIADHRFDNKNVITMMDDPRSVVGAALKYKGYSLNDMSDKALDAAREVLKSWDRNISQFDGESYKNEIQDGTSWLAHGYNGDALQVMKNNPEVGFAYPIEGTEVGVDNIVLLKKSENKELAYKFINFLLDADVAKRNAEWVEYATPNLAAYQLLNDKTKQNKIMYPPDEYLEKCEFIKNVGEDIKKLNVIWEGILNN